MDKLILLGFSISLLFISIARVHAAGNCQPIYGGGKNCTTSKDIIIDKKIQAPDGTFSDDLGNDQRFKENDILNFQISLVNTGKNTIKNLEVKDSLPGSLIFVSGAGNFNNKTKALTIKLSEIKAGDAKKYILVTKVNSVPKDLCVVNYAMAKASNVKADDNSKFCLSAFQGESLELGQTKGGISQMKAPKMTQTPPTGPELSLVLGLITTATAGLLLRRKA